MAEDDGAGLYFGEDFGQKIDLTVRIRDILRDYPEGTSILKELIQVSPSRLLVAAAMLTRAVLPTAAECR
jgi:hypothetical protein